MHELTIVSALKTVIAIKPNARYDKVMVIQRISPNDDMAGICRQLTRSRWGEDNDMANYTPAELLAFVEQEMHVLAVGYEGKQIVCSALGYALIHPDNTRRSLYVDEIDTHPEYRRRGFASEMISWLKSYALQNELTEIWLATEMEDNVGANAFYASINPTEVLKTNIYSYAAEGKRLVR